MKFAYTIALSCPCGHRHNTADVQRMKEHKMTSMLCDACTEVKAAQWSDDGWGDYCSPRYPEEV